MNSYQQATRLDLQAAAPVTTFNEGAARQGEIVGFLYFSALITVYRLLCDLAYRYVAMVFDYQGLFFNNISLRSFVMSWAILFAAMPAFYRVFRERTLSGNVIAVLILFSAIPTISAIGFRSDYDLLYVGLMVLYWAVFFLFWSIMKPLKSPRLSRMKSASFHYIVLVILIASVIIYSYINTGLRFHFSLIDVYDIRAEARQFEAPFPLNYLVSLADNLLPFFAVYALFRRNWLVLSITVFAIYVNFSIAGTKQIVFVLLCGFGGYLAIKSYAQSYRLIYGALALLVVGFFETLSLESNSISTLFAYRVLFIPSELHFSYFDYFQTHNILYFSQSLLKWASTEVRQENIQFLLGEYAIGEFTARANNGLFADAYSNLGGIGALIYPVLIAGFLRCLDGSAQGLPARVMFSIVIYVAFVLLGMTLTSALLTSGLIFLVLLLYSLPRPDSPEPA